MEKYKFSKLYPEKLSIMFTWDDNFECHYKLIAPLFHKYDFRCTFYVNPGEKDFHLYSDGYTNISKIGFEIGSHGYTHHHFSKLCESEYLEQLSKSQIEISKCCTYKPATFAFPHHDFTGTMLLSARKIYLETRNTLDNTVRYSLKTKSTIINIKDALEKAIINNHNIVFSGHGIIDVDKPDLCGYEPIFLETLDEILKIIKQYDEFNVETFLQGVIKMYIKNNCIYNNNIFLLNDKQTKYLKKYGLTKERILNLI